MTLIVASVAGSSIVVVTDSSQGAHAPTSKAVEWTSPPLLLTGFGDFSRPPTALEKHPGLARTLPRARSFLAMRDLICAELNKYVRPSTGCDASCLLFGFEEMLPVVSRISGAGQIGAWVGAPLVSPRVQAGFLVPFGFDTEIEPVCEEFDDARDFEAWARDRVAFAAEWCAIHSSSPVIQLPAHAYTLVAP
jgi:hypothetical protein